MAAKKTSSSSSPSSSKLCDSCKVTNSSLFCRADSAFLCYPCDSKIHAANSLAARHCRVLLCDVCEQAPAHVTCKADAANLCVTCDDDIHSANPLARRHVRVPISAFSHSAVDLNVIDRCSDLVEEEEESLTNHHHLHHPVAGGGGKIGEDIDSYLDFEYGFVDEKNLNVVHVKDEEVLMNLESVTATAAADDDSEVMMDCVVPAVQVEQMMKKKLDEFIGDDGGDRYGSDDYPCFDFDFLGSKAFYTNNGPSLSHSVSSCSFDARLVPDSIAMIDVSNPFERQTKNVTECAATTTTTQAVPSMGIDREARVLRYREKRKNRKFEKTIRYASRKAYAETRPRIKGRFVKRTDTCVDNENAFESQHGFGDLGYGIVPSF